MKIKSWSVFLEEDHYPTSSYKLQGFVYGHPKISDGMFMYSEDTVSIIDKGTHKVVKTQDGLVYELYKEEVNPKYETQFPNSYEKLRVFGKE